MKNLRNVPRKIQVHENIEEIIRQEIAITKHEEPFYICNLAAIVSQHKNWLLKLPRVKPFYAVKCNPTPIMIEVLAALGANFDCASKGEIESVLALNITPDRIIYANPCKTRSYIKHAKSKDVSLMTFDNETELKKIADLYPEARLVIRIKVDDSHSLFQFSTKFGCSLDEAYHLLDYAKNLNLNVVGVSFHVGSGCESALSYESAIQDAKNIFNYGLNCGFQMNVLDLGGGFPGTPNTPVTFEEMADVINQTLDKEFPSDYIENLEVIAEPGRYYAASVFTLATQIIAKKEHTYNSEEIQINRELIEKEGLFKYIPNLVDDQQVNEQKLKNIDQNRGVMYYLNESCYGSFSNVFFENVKVNPQPYYLNNDENAIKMSKLNYLNTTLFGPTCDSLDVIRKNIYLPEMNIGDWVIFREMGAYTISTSCGFNGFNLPTIKYYLDNHCLNALKILVSWPRIKNCIMKIEEQEEKIELFNQKVLPSCSSLKKLNKVLPKLHHHQSKQKEIVLEGLIPVH